MAKQQNKSSRVEVPAKVEAPKPTAVVPTGDYGNDANLGFDKTTQADFTIPFLGIVQSNSPELIDSDARHIPGCKPGSLFNTVTRELYPDGVIFVPCDTQHMVVEWRPRTKGGGFAGTHQIDSDIVAKAKAGSTQFGKYSTAEGNDLTETFYMYGMSLADPNDLENAGLLVVAFTSTKIKKYKQVMTSMRTMKGKPPLFAHRLLIKSVSEKNQKGQFFNYDITPALGNFVESLIPPTLDGNPHPLLLAGRELLENVRGGMAKAAHETQERSDGDETGAPDGKNPF